MDELIKRERETERHKRNGNMHPSDTCESIQRKNLAPPYYTAFNDIATDEIKTKIR